MSDAIVEAFNDAGTWNDVLTAIQSNATALLDDLYPWKFSFLVTDADRKQALGLSINEIKTLFGNFTSFSKVEAVVKRQIDVEFAKYEFVLTFDTASTAEEIRTSLGQVQLLHDDRESIIREWSSNDDPAIKARAAELEAEPYTIVLRKIATHLGDGAYLDALAAEMMSAREEHGPFDDLDTLIQALDDAADALGSEYIVIRFNEAADWEAMLAAIKLNAPALLDPDHLAKLVQLTDESAYEQTIGLGVAEIKALFEGFTSIEQIMTAVEQQIDIVHGRFAALAAINSAHNAGSMAAALTIHVARLDQHRQELIFEWRASGDADAVARATELEAEAYTIVLSEVSSHLGNTAYLAELTARMWSARQNSSFLNVDALIAALDVADRAIDATHDAVISGVSSGTMGEDDAQSLSSLLTIEDGDWGENRLRLSQKVICKSSTGHFPSTVSLGNGALHSTARRNLFGKISKLTRL
jgi:hypothetical protein